MDRDKYWFWLSSVPKIGVRTSMKLLNYFGDIKEIYAASERILLESHLLNKGQLDNIIYSRNSDKIEADFEDMHQKGIRLLSCENEEYPEAFKNLYDPPIAIYIKGHLPRREEWMIAVIGARSCSSYGREIGHMLSRGIAYSGVTIVSGMARGIDSEAHKGALEADGRTFAVLGCGVDVCYPPENIDLYVDICRNGGIISEFPPGTAPEPANFPRRNRLIAALSKGILVIEARRKSGSLITVEHGLNLGKEIFAVPGRVYDPLSEGCNQLIRAGAKAVLEPSDVLDEFGILAREYKKNNITLDNYEKVVYSSICLVPRGADEIAALTDLSVSKVIQILIVLEMKGAIHRVGKNQYVLSV